MKLKASAPRRGKQGLHEACEKLTLEAKDDEGMAFLASIWRAFVFGGNVTVIPTSGETTEHQFFGIDV